MVSPLPCFIDSIALVEFLRCSDASLLMAFAWCQDELARQAERVSDFGHRQGCGERLQVGHSGHEGVRPLCVRLQHSTLAVMDVLQLNARVNRRSTDAPVKLSS